MELNKEEFDAAFASESTNAHAHHRLGAPIASPWVVRHERIESYMDFAEVTTSDVFLWAFVFHQITLKRPVGGYFKGERFRAAIVDVSRGVVTFVRQL